MNDNITKSIILCKRLFLLFDEIWFIGPRSDHCDTIIDLSIIKEQDIKVTHIHNQIGRFLLIHILTIQEKIVQIVFGVYLRK